MGTFLGSYRLEKRSKSHRVSENTFTIGISIQMNIPCCPSIRIHFVLLLKSAGKMTSCKKYLVPEAVLWRGGGRCYPSTFRRSSKPQRKRPGRELARRSVVFVKKLKPCCWSQCEANHMRRTRLRKLSLYAGVVI